ncbi:MULTISPECIES: hypothetical protein [Saccharothrix]|nr:hypothetical protein [Saccharothrix sp. CB00851]
MVFKIGQDVELYVDPKALTKISEAAAEAVELAGAVAADPLSPRSR